MLPETFQHRFPCEDLRRLPNDIKDADPDIPILQEATWSMRSRNEARALTYLTPRHRRCAVVTDFGLARSIQANSSPTHTGIVGTVDYMAPEQVRGEETTAAADIYAFGIVMYEMVTGQRPFTGDSTVTVALKHLNDEPQPPKDLAPNLDPNWNETIIGCLRKDPHQRFQSAAEVKALIVQDGTKLRRQFQRNRWTRCIRGHLSVSGLLLGPCPFRKL